MVVMIRLPAFGEHAILEKARALSVPPDEQELKAVGDARHAPSGVACRVLLGSDHNLLFIDTHKAHLMHESLLCVIPKSCPRVVSHEPVITCPVWCAELRPGLQLCARRVGKAGGGGRSKASGTVLWGKTRGYRM